MSDSHSSHDDHADLASMGAAPDNARGLTVLVVLFGAFVLMVGTIVFALPGVMKVTAGLVHERQLAMPTPQLDALRATERELLATASKLDNGLFRIPIAGAKAALLANPLLLASAGSAPAPAPTEATEAAPELSEVELVAKGLELFTGAKICSSCHKADSADRLVGPGLKGIMGRAETMADGAAITVDEAYLRESLLDPNSKVVEGFPPAMVPQTYTDLELNALIAYLKTL